MESVPIIFTPSHERQTLGFQGRIVALAVSLTCLTGLIVAATLKPAREGVGTHLAMGFQRCQFLRSTGLPCPTCGMTTSFAWFVRGNWLASFYVQPMGFMLALAAAGCFWAGLYIALTGKPLHRLLSEVRAIVIIPTIMGFAVAAWAWKIFIHLHGMDGWGM